MPPLWSSFDLRIVPTVCLAWARNQNHALPALKLSSAQPRKNFFFLHHSRGSVKSPRELFSKIIHERVSVTARALCFLHHSRGSVGFKLERQCHEYGSGAVAFHASNDRLLRTEPFLERMGPGGRRGVVGGGDVCLRWRLVRGASREWSCWFIVWRGGGILGSWVSYTTGSEGSSSNYVSVRIYIKGLEVHPFLQLDQISFRDGRKSATS